MPLRVSELKFKLNKTIKESGWICATQEDIDAFAKVSGDNQWIHVDPDKCALYSPTRTTIVHGNYWVTIISALLMDVIEDKTIKMGYNYGYDKVRFVQPVPVNEKVKMIFKLSTYEEEDKNVKFTIATTVVNEKEETVAYIEVLTMLILR